jgi:hypothetical protein
VLDERVELAAMAVDFFVSARYPLTRRVEEAMELELTLAA